MNRREMLKTSGLALGALALGTPVFAEPPKGYYTGIKLLDRMGPVLPGSLVGIYSKCGDGKTTLAKQIGGNNANYGNSFHIPDLERTFDCKEDLVILDEWWSSDFPSCYTLIDVNRVVDVTGKACIITIPVQRGQEFPYGATNLKFNRVYCIQKMPIIHNPKNELEMVFFITAWDQSFKRYFYAAVYVIPGPRFVEI